MAEGAAGVGLADYMFARVKLRQGMWGPKGTPREIISRLNQSLGRILQQPDTQERLRADGREPAHTTPEEFLRVISREIAKWNKVVQAGNIKVQ